MTFEEVLKFIYNQANLVPRGTFNKGLSIKINQASWYSDAYGFDVVNSALSLLRKYELSNLSQMNLSGINIIVSSSELTVLDTLRS